MFLSNRAPVRASVICAARRIIGLWSDKPSDEQFLDPCKFWADKNFVYSNEISLSAFLKRDLVDWDCFAFPNISFYFLESRISWRFFGCLSVPVLSPDTNCSSVFFHFSCLRFRLQLQPNVISQKPSPNKSKTTIQENNPLTGIAVNT